MSKQKDEKIKLFMVFPFVVGFTEDISLKVIYGEHNFFVRSEKKERDGGPFSALKRMDLLSFLLLVRIL